MEDPDQNQPPREMTTQVVHHDPLARVERIDLPEPIRVRSEQLEGFQLARKQRTRETTLTPKNRIVLVTTQTLYLVHTRLHTYLCTEDQSVNGRLLALLILDPQDQHLTPQQLVHFVSLVRYVDTTDEALAQPSRAPDPDALPRKRGNKGQFQSETLTPEELDPPLPEQPEDET